MISESHGLLISVNVWEWDGWCSTPAAHQGSRSVGCHLWPAPTPQLSCTTPTHSLACLSHQSHRLSLLLFTSFSCIPPQKKKKKDAKMQSLRVEMPGQKTTALNSCGAAGLPAVSLRCTPYKFASSWNSAAVFRRPSVAALRVKTKDQQH